MAFDGLRRNRQARQFAQQGAGTLEAGTGGSDAGHAQRRRREEGVFHAAGAVTRAETVAAAVAVILTSKTAHAIKTVVQTDESAPYRCATERFHATRVYPEAVVF